MGHLFSTVPFLGGGRHGDPFPMLPGQALKRCHSAIWLHDGECGNGVLTDAEEGRLVPMAMAAGSVWEATEKT